VRELVREMDILSIRSANYSKQDEPLYKRWFEFADTGLNTVPYIFCQEETICDEEGRKEGRKGRRRRRRRRKKRERTSGFVLLLHHQLVISVP
jgi:hypothetical protein